MGCLIALPSDWWMTQNTQSFKCFFVRRGDGLGLAQFGSLQVWVSVFEGKLVQGIRVLQHVDAGRASPVDVAR